MVVVRKITVTYDDDFISVEFLRGAFFRQNKNDVNEIRNVDDVTELLWEFNSLNSLGPWFSTFITSSPPIHYLFFNFLTTFFAFTFYILLFIIFFTFLYNFLPFNI